MMKNLIERTRSNNPEENENWRKKVNLSPNLD
jgi:hypothetical protein